MTKRVFISYKWENKAHSAWIERFYCDLRMHGIDAVLDKYEVAPGQSFSDYMTREIRNADHVLFIATPLAVHSLESGRGALAFEIQVANARRLSGKGDRYLIPVLRAGNYASSYLLDNRYADFRNDAQYSDSLRELVAWLKEEIKPPRLGVDTSSASSIAAALPRLQTLDVSGWAVGQAKEGEHANIQLESVDEEDNLLGYLRRASNDSWPVVGKSYYLWTLVWDPNKGVVAVSRMGLSPK